MSTRQHPFQPILTGSIRDPMHRDSCCIVGIYYAATRISLSPSRDMILDGHALLRIVMRFICGATSEKEHLRVCQRLLTCQCNLHDPITRELHRNAQGRTPEECFDFTIRMLGAHTSGALAGLAAGKFRRKAKDNTPAERQPWPGSVSDILPNGQTEAQVLDALLRWAAEPGQCEVVFSIICSLAHFWEPFAVEVLRRPDVFFLATRHLREAAATYPGQPDIWTIKVKILALFFNGMLRVDSRGVAHAVAHLLEPLDQIGQYMGPMLDGVKGLEEPRYLFEHVHRMAVHKLNPKASMSGNIIVEAYGPAPLTPAQEMCVGAFNTIWEVRNRNQCLYLACPNGPMVARSAVCARCGVVRYCSRECQKAAWKDDAWSHKPLCSKISALRAGLGMAEPRTWDHVTLDSGLSRWVAGLLEMCDPYLAELEESLLFDVGNGISCLTNEKVVRIQSNWTEDPSAQPEIESMEIH
ncbi:hypothetical protein B0H15DRAFT_289881 [Mycena belliarum]|uniref:MYND-type domain-containing protein n=1 Tax=Mycena belliarum TaxID=1033014 RepID=A0AAD6U5Y9_9AGAR|nr:hypothetical protein B0H15DRAFT_289881 [Mycena belliae]